MLSTPPTRPSGLPHPEAAAHRRVGGPWRDRRRSRPRRVTSIDGGDRQRASRVGAAVAALSPSRRTPARHMPRPSAAARSSRVRTRDGGISRHHVEEAEGLPSLDGNGDGLTCIRPVADGSSGWLSTCSPSPKPSIRPSSTTARPVVPAVVADTIRNAVRGLHTGPDAGPGRAEPPRRAQTWHYAWRRSAGQPPYGTMAADRKPARTTNGSPDDSPTAVPIPRPRSSAG